MSPCGDEPEAFEAFVRRVEPVSLRQTYDCQGPMNLEDRLRHHGDSIRRSEFPTMPIDDIRARATRQRADSARALGAVSLIVAAFVVGAVLGSSSTPQRQTTLVAATPTELERSTITTTIPTTALPQAEPHVTTTLLYKFEAVGVVIDGPTPAECASLQSGEWSGRWSSSVPRPETRGLAVTLVVDDSRVSGTFTLDGAPQETLPVSGSVVCRPGDVDGTYIGTVDFGNGFIATFSSDGAEIWGTWDLDASGRGEWMATHVTP